jgi:VanZ family protein
MQHSSRLIGPFVRWLFPHLSEQTVDAIVFGVRKCAHLTEYSVLALLFWRCIRKPVKNDPRPWSWPLAAAAVLFVTLYATTDEIHQTFVPNRQGSAWDVLIDTVGGMAGILALWLLRYRCRRRRIPQPA